MICEADIDKVHPGTTLIADGGFDCLPEGSEREVFQDYEKNMLFVLCNEGKHYLVGQISEDHKNYVGFQVNKEKSY